LTLSQLTHARARQPMIEKQPGIEVIVKVDQKLQTTLFDHVLATARAQFVVLVGALLTAAHAQMNMFEADAGHLG
jgi:hypothetical protein